MASALTLSTLEGQLMESSIMIGGEQIYKVAASQAAAKEKKEEKKMGDQRSDTGSEKLIRL